VDRNALARSFDAMLSQSTPEVEDDEIHISPNGWIETTIADVFHEVLLGSPFGAIDE
jgi:hypothetical protein